MANSLQHGRVHALDNLRAAMMWLGVVLHVSVNHMAGPAILPFKDRDVSQYADFTVFFIHTFRMPVFFVLAGFLAAMMVSKRGNATMVRNRLRRIALPFALFWPVLFVATVVLVFAFRHMMSTGSFGLSMADAPQRVPGRPLLNTMHMWFVYYLFLFCMLAGAACALEKFIPARVASAWRALFEVLARNWWGFLLLAIPLALVGSGYRAGILAPTGSFIPNFSELVHNGVFFVFGWAVYRLRDEMLAYFAKHCWKFACAGLAFYIAAGGIFNEIIKDPLAIPHVEMLAAYVYGCASWLWSIALIGLFVRYLSTQNRALRYLSDSSYWVFMVHMLCTIGFGVLLYNTPFGALGKMAINILATTVTCLVTYHLFVRNTWIGVLLNGKRRGGDPTLSGIAAAQP